MAAKLEAATKERAESNAQQKAGYRDPNLPVEERLPSMMCALCCLLGLCRRADTWPAVCQPDACSYCSRARLPSWSHHATIAWGQQCHLGYHMSDALAHRMHLM